MKLKMKRAAEEDNHPSKKMRIAETGKNPKVFLRRSRRDLKKAAATVTPYKAPPNPALNKTPEVNPLLDPFKSPTFSQLNRYDELLGDKTLMIGSIKTNSAWFNRLDDANKTVHREEADAAMMMFNSKRQEHASYFHNNWFLRASFCTSVFFNELLSSYNNFKNPRVKKPFSDSVCKVARGEAYPNQNWKTDVDVIYGVTKVGKHWIGFGIDLNKRTIESFACNHPQENKGGVFDIVTRIAEMIPALLCIAENIKPMKNMVPFKIVNECEEGPKSSTISNCGIFVLKKIQCHSLKIEDFSRICDSVIHDLRSTLAWEIFDCFRHG